MNNNIKKMRELRKIPQRQIGELWGTDQSYVSGVEKGTKSLNVEKLILVADLFACTTDEVLGRDSEIDRSIMARLKKISAMPEGKKKVILKSLDMLIAGSDV
jgi:transcriptional regulator with XRE-family HTH domain